MNNATVSGNLGRDMEVRAEDDGELVGEISIGVNEYLGKDEDGTTKNWTTWVTAVIYGRARVQRHQDKALKGRRVTVTGPLRTKRYRISDERSVPLTFIRVEEIEWGDLPRHSSEQQT